jgi:hypothetical protein
MQPPAGAGLSQSRLELLQCHGAAGFDHAVRGAVLPKLQVRAQIFFFNIPYRVKTFTPKTGWSAMAGQIKGVLRCRRHAALLWENKVIRMDSQHIRVWVIARSNSQKPSTRTRCRKAITTFLHASE